MLNEYLSRIIDGKNSVRNDYHILAGHDAAIAQEFYSVKIWKGINREVAIDVFQKHEITPNDKYLSILESCNGLKFGKISLFGIPPGRLSSINYIDRENAVPMDLISANKSWKFEKTFTKSAGLLIGVVSAYSKNFSIYINGDGPLTVNFGKSRGVVEYNDIINLLMDNNGMNLETLKISPLQ